MTDNDVIKYAEMCCQDNPHCLSCPFDDVSVISAECMSELMKKLVDLIIRQKAEIDKLKEHIKHTNNVVKQVVSDAKSEAVKEFAKRAYKLICNKENWNVLKVAWLDNGECYWLKRLFDNLVKEMAGDNSDRT